jgi:hypothetical protein
MVTYKNLNEEDKNTDENNIKIGESFILHL